MLVLDYDQLAEVVAAYKEFDEFVFDVETKGEHPLDPGRNEVFWISLAGPGRADVIPMGHPLGTIIRYEAPLTKTGKVSLSASAMPTPIYSRPPSQLWPEEVFGGLEPLFFSKRRKIGHNTKFDLQSIAKYYGILPPPPYGDTSVAAHLINENHIGYKPYGLESCVKREMGFTWEKSFGKNPAAAPFNIAARYSYFDAKYTWLLDRHLKPILEEEGMLALYEMEMEVLEVVCHMEMRGVDIDVPAIKAADESFAAEIAEVYAKVEKAAGWKINLNADAEVRKLVYEIRKHKPKVFTKVLQEPSIAAKALAPYAVKDPIVGAVVKWADLSKMHTTFIKGIQSRLVDGRVHCDFDQRGARTGRFSSRTPNLQNIPTRQTKVIRDIFIAPPGHKLVVGDYSQIELRLLAHYTQDPLLIKAYTEGLDLHTLTATRAYHTKEPTERERSLAKNVNFSMVYGGGPATIMARYEVPYQEAQNLIDAFFSTYTRVKPWTAAVIKKCKTNRVSAQYAEWTGKKESPPYVETILGRKRRLPEIFWSDFEHRGLAERQAVNTVIQGSAGDICKVAMVNVLRAFEGRPWHLILTVHDELVSVVPEEDAEEARTVQQKAMEDLTLPVKLRVPLVAEVKICSRWSEK